MHLILGFSQAWAAESVAVSTFLQTVWWCDTFCPETHRDVHITSWGHSAGDGKKLDV